MDDLTDDELQRIEDIQFEDELTAFVAELPPPTPTMEGDYQAKMAYLHSIHAEVFPEPPAPEWDHDESFDSRYYHEYTVGGNWPLTTAANLLDWIRMNDTTETTETATETKIRRHGRSVERNSLTFPSGEWSLKDAHALNNGVCHATIYHYVKDQVALGLMIQCGTRKNKRGKASLLYRMSTPADVPNTAEVDSNQPFWQSKLGVSLKSSNFPN